MCWQCENPDGDFAAELIRGIDKHGWRLLGIGATETTPEYVYTVGLPYRFNHPELIMVGALTEVGAILNAMVEYIKDSGRRLEPGQTMRLGDADFAFAKMNPESLGQPALDGGEIVCSDEVNLRLGVEPLGAVQVLEHPLARMCERHFEEELHAWLSS